MSVLQAFQWRYVSSQEKHSSLPSLQWARHLYFFFGTDFVTHSSHIMMFSFSEGSSVVGNVLFLQLLHVLYMQDIFSLYTLACTMSLGEDVATIPS